MFHFLENYGKRDPHFDPGGPSAQGALKLWIAMLAIWTCLFGVDMYTLWRRHTGAQHPMHYGSTLLWLAICIANIATYSVRVRRERAPLEPR